MTDQPINNDALAKTTMTFVIGATASGKTAFIQNYFSNNRNTVILNVYDYRQAAYKEAGFSKHIPLGQEFKCLYKANENLLVDIIDTLSHKYEVERIELKTKIASLNEKIDNLSTMQQNKDRFINAIRRFMEMQKLTAPLLRELIDEITVYETEGVGKNRSQRIMIHYKFIWYIEIPECGSNYKADTRKGVSVEYITKSA